MTTVAADPPRVIVQYWLVWAALKLYALALVIALASGSTVLAIHATLAALPICVLGLVWGAHHDDPSQPDFGGALAAGGWRYWTNVDAPARRILPLEALAVILGVVVFYAFLSRMSGAGGAVFGLVVAPIFVLLLNAGLKRRLSGRNVAAGEEPNLAAAALKDAAVSVVEPVFLLLRLGFRLLTGSKLFLALFAGSLGAAHLHISPGGPSYFLAAAVAAVVGHFAYRAWKRRVG
ncbi:MAG: hypothetical protein ACFB2Z_01190 [Maricaulaceae bacterium]